MNKCSAVALALGAAGIAAICLGRRCQPEPVSDLKKQLRQIHDDLFVQRRLSVDSRRVLNDAHKMIHTVTKTLEKQAS